MTDLVEKLRYMQTVEGREVAGEAADEIERLRIDADVLRVESRRLRTQIATAWIVSQNLVTMLELP